MISLSQLNNQYLINLLHSCLRRAESGLTHKNSQRTTCGCSKTPSKGQNYKKGGGRRQKLCVIHAERQECKKQGGCLFSSSAERKRLASPHRENKEEWERQRRAARTIVVTSRRLERGGAPWHWWNRSLRTLNEAVTMDNVPRPRSSPGAVGKFSAAMRDRTVSVWKSIIEMKTFTWSSPRWRHSGKGSRWSGIKHLQPFFPPAHRCCFLISLLKLIQYSWIKTSFFWTAFQPC